MISIFFVYFLSLFQFSLDFRLSNSNQNVRWDKGSKTFTSITVQFSFTLLLFIYYFSLFLSYFGAELLLESTSAARMTTLEANERQNIFI